MRVAKARARLESRGVSPQGMVLGRQQSARAAGQGRRGQGGSEGGWGDKGGWRGHGGARGGGGTKEGGRRGKPHLLRACACELLSSLRMYATAEPR